MAITPKIRFEVFKKNDFSCQYCGRKTPEVILELDHIIPKSKGGDDDIENLITSCFECNRGKGATPLETILRDKDIHEETILMAEREIQLAEYNHIKQKVRCRIEEQSEILSEHYAEKFGNYYEYAKESFPSQNVKVALKIMSYTDIMDDIDYAVFKTKLDGKGDYHNIAAAKYLVAILRNKSRDIKSNG